MWDLPRPGLEPVSPALAGGFLTTAPPGKPLGLLLKCSCQFTYLVFEPVVKLEHETEAFPEQFQYLRKLLFP